jgi:hypothetical protein
MMKAAQKQMEVSLVYFRSDGAPEYQRKGFQKYFREEGVRHEIAGRHCPQQIIERLNRTNSCGKDSLHAYWSRVGIKAMAFFHPVCRNCIQCMSTLCAEWKIS